MKKIIKILFLIGFTTIYAQNTLSGKITDEYQKPLSNVEIYILKLHRGTTTNSEGNYVLKNIPNGKWIVDFKSVGYKTISKKLLFSAEKKIANIQLDEDVFEIDDVIVSVPFRKIQSENVIKVERLSLDAFQKSGATTLAEGLDNILGVSQISTGTSIGKPVIRGVSGNRVLVYTQGVRLENQQFGAEHGLGINDNGISSVEVIKGPSSLLYGSDAMGGVVYINPEKFGTNDDTKISVSQKLFSNTLGSNSSVGIKTGHSNWQFLARGSTVFHADYKIPTQKRVTNTRFKENDLKLGVKYNKNSFLSELRYNFNHSKLGIPEEGIKEQSKSYDPLLPYQKIDNHIVSFHNKILLKNSKIEADFGYVLNDRSEFEDHEHEEEHEEHEDEHEDEHEQGEEASLQMKLKTFNYNIKYYLPKINNIETIFGVQGMHQKNKNLGEEVLIPNAQINDVGIFTAINYQWNNNFLQAGIRFDNRAIDSEEHSVSHGEHSHTIKAIDKTFKNVTASVGINSLLYEKLRIRANIANGFRAPNLAELTSNGIHHGANRYEIGNATLENENNIQFDLSLEYNVSHFELFANVFLNRINNYIYIEPTSKVAHGAPVYKYTQNDAKLYGGEFGVHFHPHPIDWLHFKSNFEWVVGKQDTNYLPLIPANKWKNTIRAEFNTEWIKEGYVFASVHTAFNQNNIGVFETKTKGYSLFNLGVGGMMKLGKYKWNTSFSIQNLFDKEYTNHLSRLKTNGIPNIGRNIVLGIHFEL